MMIGLLILFSCVTFTAPQTPKPVWHTGWATVYAQHFEGRPTAWGPRFKHSGRLLASRKIPFGHKIEIRYGKNGRTICTSADRLAPGRDPVSRGAHFDLPRQAARELGLYAYDKHGRQIRAIRWRLLPNDPHNKIPNLGSATGVHGHGSHNLGSPHPNPGVFRTPPKGNGGMVLRPAYLPIPGYAHGSPGSPPAHIRTCGMAETGWPLVVHCHDSRISSRRTCQQRR